VSSDSKSPQDAVYKLDVTPPRDPAAYRITDHFRYRMNHRRNPSIDGDLVRRCIEEGRIKHTQEANRFFFELELDYRFRVLVALRDSAFFDPEQKHRALTVYAVGADHGVEEGWEL